MNKAKRIRESKKSRESIPSIKSYSWDEDITTGMNQSAYSRFANETYNSSFKPSYLEHNIIEIIEPVLLVLRETKNDQIALEATDLILNIVEILQKIRSMNIDISKIPTLNAINLEDGSMLIEWIFPNYRIGLSIEENIEDSSWYLVSLFNKVDYNMSGNLADANKKELLIKLVLFASNYS